MACYPKRQIFDGSRPAYTNNPIVCALEGEVTEIRMEGDIVGAENNIIPIFYENDETGEFDIPYTDPTGTQFALTNMYRSIILEPGRCYRFDTTNVEGNPTVKITASAKQSNISTSERACLIDENGNSTEVEVVRYEDFDTPVVYFYGTRYRAALGEFSRVVRDCPEPKHDEVPRIVRITGENSFDMQFMTESITIAVIKGDVRAEITGSPDTLLPTGIALTWGIVHDEVEALQPHIRFVGTSPDSDFIVTSILNVGGVM